MSFAAFMHFNLAGGEFIQPDPSFMWTMKDVTPPGEVPEDAGEVDKRFEGELLFERVGDELWGYCLVGGRAAVMSCETGASHIVVPTTLGGCTVAYIGPRAFATMDALERVELSDSIEEVCNFAFMFSGLERFEAPPRLRVIGTRAFYSCQNLSEVVLSCPLESIGSEALSMTPVPSLTLPATVQEIGPNAFANSGIRLGSPGCTLFIEGGSSCFIDDEGGLYERSDDGLLFRALLSRDAQDYHVLEGTVEVCARACAQNTGLRSVTLPDGLRFIRDAAFSGCTQLEHVELPATLEAIGASAFKNCGMRSLRIPRGLHSLGHSALATTTGDIFMTPVIQRIEVEEGNESFYVVDGLLCLRGNPASGDVALFYFGRGGEVRIPASVGAIGPSAFAGQTSVTRLILHDHISYVDTNGFFFRGGLTELVFLNAAPDGSDVTVMFPDGAGGMEAVRRSFQDHRADAQAAMACADSALFGAAERADRYILTCKRLQKPLWLSEHTREQLVAALRRAPVKACVAFAENNYLDGFSVLCDEGILNRDTFDDAVEAVSKTGEVLAVNKLLALRSRKFGSTGFDFDL